MTRQRWWAHGTVAFAMLLAAAPAPLRAQQSSAEAVHIGDNDLGGTVTSANGPEAGVWVIAETTELADQIRQDRRHRRPRALCDARPAQGQLQRLGTRLRAGRFAAKIQTAPGKIVEPEGDDRRRMRLRRPQYYPAIYWYSMLKIPDKSQFPGTGSETGACRTNMKTQAQWLNIIKTDGCYVVSRDSEHWQRGRSRKSSAISILPQRHGSGASSPGKR